LNDQRWQRLWELFHDAGEVPERDRAAWLAAHEPDPELRREVAELLAAGGVEGGLLAAGVPAELLAPDAPSGSSLSASRHSDARPPGDRIGGYLLRSIIGEGGMGVVYLAEQDRPVHREVALKLIKPGMDSREVVARFARERQALAVMDHPGIATVHDAGTTDDGRPYFVMEHVAGLPIDRYCDQRRLGVRARVELFCAVCRAVQHAHQKGVVHRDLKPGNVLVVESDGVPLPKVIDFGIAKAVEPGLDVASLRTALGAFVGTPEFTSPEQAGGHLDVDTRADVYSLGALLYALLVGRPPFDGERLRRCGWMELQRILVEEEPPPPSVRFARLDEAEAAEVARNRDTTPGALSRALAGDLDWILGRAMDKDRGRRYDSASQLAADLGRHLRDQPVVAGPPSRAYRIGKFVRRHRAAVTIAAVAAVLLLAFTTGLTVQGRRVTVALARAEAEQARAETVSTFLVDLFTAVDPDLGGGAVTARELLDQGAARVPRELAAQPHLQGTLLDVLGSVYQSLGVYDRARVLHEQALSLRDGAATPAERAATLGALGLACSRAGDYAAARRHLAEALRLQRATAGDGSPEVATVLYHLAEVDHDEGDYAGAEGLYRRALAIRERAMEGGVAPQAAGRDLAESLLGLAALLRDRGDHPGAEAIGRRALDLRQRLFGDDHPAVAEARDALAVALYQQKRYDEAEPLYRRALASRERLLGPSHPAVAQNLSGLGLLLKKRGDPAAAEPLLRRALAIYRARLGEEHAYVATALNNLAGALYDRGDFTGAEPLYRDALARWRRSLGEEHPNLAAGYLNLGQTLVALDRETEAEPLFRRALAIDRRELGDASPYVADDWQELGELLAATGRREEAAEALRQALAIREASGDSAAAARVRAHLAGLR
jgi:serine/threonine protein kinase/tetratricopeptide (TPR) repeat protein